MPETYGWFADQEDPAEDGYNPSWSWIPCLQVPGSCHVLDGVWFASRQDCEEFIRDNILNKPMI